MLRDQVIMVVVLPFVLSLESSHLKPFKSCWTTVRSMKSSMRLICFSRLRPRNWHSFNVRFGGGTRHKNSGAVFMQNIASKFFLVSSANTNVREEYLCVRINYFKSR